MANRHLIDAELITLSGRNCQLGAVDKTREPQNLGKCYYRH